MRIKLILIVLPLLLGGWFDDPPAWARPDGRPIDPVVFAHDRSVCRYQASAFSGREDLWILTFRNCMLSEMQRYLPLNEISGWNVPHPRD
jgi:hypothetical protein